VRLSGAHKSTAGLLPHAAPLALPTGCGLPRQGSKISKHPQIQPKYSLARCRPNTPKYRQINDVAVFGCAYIRTRSPHRIPGAWPSVCFAVRPCLRRASSPAAARARLHGPCGVACGGSGVCALDPPRRRRCRRRTADVGPRRRRTEVGGSARSLILVWRVDPARRVAPRARPGGGGGRLNRFR